MSGKNDLEKLISEHTRRLQKREEQQARYGIATEPHILNEIEDIKTKLAELHAELATLKEIIRLNPYRGLFAFREEDEPFFFGRETFTAQLVASVQQKPLVTVLGPSGSGKSSIVFAGLVPNLTRSGQWCFATFRPGKEPFLGLAGALVPLYETDLSKTEQLGATRALSVSLHEGRYPLSDVLHLIHQTHPNRHLLIIADQFEELYTLCRDPGTRQMFLDMLLQVVVAASEASMRLVLAMRADFLGEALLYPPLGNVLQDTTELLSSMNPAELRMAIEKPAERQQVHFEPGLVERILEDVGNEPGNLPLLEFALTALWAQQAQSELTHSAYEAVGGVEGALSRHADAVVASLGEAEQVQAQRVFVQLVRPGEGIVDTRRLAYRHELDETDWELVQRLASERLVVTDWDPVGQETVEVAHEALIRGWEQLKDWVDQNRDFRTWQERLRVALHQWQDSEQQDEGILLRGRPLADAGRWLIQRESDLSRAERDFIQASQDLQKREHKREQLAKRFRRRTLIWGTLLLLLITLLLVRFWWSLICPRFSGNCPTISVMGITLLRADLRDASYVTHDFRGFNLQGADIRGAKMALADLRGADLRGADLRRADLRRTKLQGIILEGAFLEGALLEEADLQGVNLQGVFLSRADLPRADLRQAVFPGLLEDSNLEGANLEGATLLKTTLRRVNLKGANLKGANLEGVHMEEVNLQDVFFDRRTVWPDGFDPETAGAILVEE